MTIDEEITLKIPARLIAVIPRIFFLALLDLVKAKCEDADHEVAKYIHELRLEIHNVIDDCVRKKMEKAHVASKEESKVTTQLSYS
jgi:hypothetical protein